MKKVKYPIGIQSFASIREDGYVYVDKTEQVYDLANNGKFYFLSRPRRFGKSLLVSTLDAYFCGRKDLFKGLAIDKLEKDWTEYPVFHIDLSNVSYNSPELLKEKLSSEVAKWEEEYGTNEKSSDPAIRFGTLIRLTSKKQGKKVVILVDEYDAPLVNLIHKPELLEANRETLSGFYKNLKANDQYIKFAFLTGVTKFGQLSVFSALNNLKDISLNERYQKICGITEEELHRDFDDGVATMAVKNKMTKEECYDRLKEMYDGYHFCKEGVGMYNPFSLLNALDDKEFGSYWFQTGTPTALMLALRDTNADITHIAGQMVNAEVLQSVNSYQTDLTALLYQSGYLTITGVAPTGALIIDFPNEEVRLGFTNQLIPIYSSLSSGTSSSLSNRIKLALMEGDVDTYIAEMRTLIASIQYEFFKQTEQAFQFIFYVTGILLDAKDLLTTAEKRTNRGRIDMLVETMDYIYIMEFKLDQSPEVALQQIKDKDYAEQWATDPRKKILLGVNFSTEIRNIPEQKGYEFISV